MQNILIIFEENFIFVNKTFILTNFRKEEYCKLKLIAHY